MTSESYTYSTDNQGKSIRCVLESVRNFGNMEDYLTFLLFDHQQTQTKAKNRGQGLSIFPSNNLLVWDSFRTISKTLEMKL